MFDTLWLGFMCVAIVLQAAQNALPMYGTEFTAAAGAAFQLACLFANPKAALAVLRNHVAPPAAQGPEK